MTTRLDTDPELLDLVRRADPMRDPRVQAEAGLDTESALRLLVAGLDRPPAPRRARLRHRSALRIAALAGVVAVATFVVANVASTGSGSAVSPAQAKAMIRDARAALLYPPGAVVEEDTVSRVTASNGPATNTSEVHQWWTSSPPYDNREIIIQNGKVQWEQTIVSGRLDLYDPATNTVYLAPASSPNPVSDNPNVMSALAGVHYLLGRHSAIGRVTVNPNAVLDGTRAIEFTLDGGRFTYWASPGDYRPLQSVDRQDRLPDGQRAVGVTRYPIERVLTGAAASPSLLSLVAQHPSATVDHSSADYAAAYQRLLHAPLNPKPHVLGRPRQKSRR
jgi:hypothetical protein